MIKCPKCKSTNVNKLTNTDKSGHRTAVYVCQGCGHEMEAK